jgi:transposase
MDKRSKFSYKQKVVAVRSIRSGRESCLSVARKLGCRENTVVRWLRQYNRHGVNGLKYRNGSYEGRFKLQVVRYMLAKGLSLMGAAVHFKIPNESVVRCWLKKYEQQGSAGLLEETRGRKKTTMTKRVKKKATVNANTTDEKLAALQKEVEYLRAENAFLKKLDALIQQEKADKKQSRRPKPSRN